MIFRVDVGLIKTFLYICCCCFFLHSLEYLMVYLNSFGKIVTLLQLHFNSQFQAITIWNCVTPKDLTKFLRLQYWFSSPVGFLSLPSELVNPLKISLQHNKFLICMELGDRICHYWGGGGGGGTKGGGGGHK